MNLGSWGSYLPRFKNLIRPDGVSAVGEAEENVESTRNVDSAKMAIATITNALPNLVFDGYRDWYSYDDEWVLRNLGQVLTAEEEHEILGQLDQGTPESLAKVLDYIASERLGIWQNIAREEFSQPEGDAPAEELQGEANTANWQASRTPGTYYYTYLDGRYLYCDLSSAPLSEWETMPVRDDLAARNAEPWGVTGWFYTPVGEPGLYGGDFVFAASPDGPWVTEEQASAQLQPPPAAEPEVPPVIPRRYDPIEQVTGYAMWAQGFDTQERVWKFTLTNGSEPPDDDAPWTAIDTYRANNTEYFAGPGYSDSGWLAVPTPLPSEAVETPDQDSSTEESRPEDSSTEDKVRAEIVDPAIELIKEAFPALTDEQAEQLVVTVMKQDLQTV